VGGVDCDDGVGGGVTGSRAVGMEVREAGNWTAARFEKVDLVQESMNGFRR